MNDLSRGGFHQEDVVGKVIGYEQLIAFRLGDDCDARRIRSQGSFRRFFMDRPALLARSEGLRGNLDKSFRRYLSRLERVYGNAVSRVLDLLFLFERLGSGWIRD